MSGFAYNGHVYEFKSSRRGKGSITTRAVTGVLRAAKEVLHDHRRNIRSFKFLFPINRMSDEAEALIEEFSAKNRVRANGYGQDRVQFLVDSLQKSDKELYRMILKAIEVAVESEEEDGED